MRFGGSARVVPQSVIELLGQLEELDCSSKSSSGQVGTGMLFPPASVWNEGLAGVRAFFSGDAVDIELKGAGIRVEDVDDLARGLEKVAVRSMDLSENGALGTSGAARLVGGLGRGVKSVSLKGTGLGHAAGQVSPYHGQQLLACSCEDWTRLEGALGGLAALEAIDELSGRDCAGLQVLDLSCNQLGPVGAEHAVAALKELTGLQDLNLCGNMLGRVGGECVVAALRGLTRLQVLNLGNNGFDASMCYAVASTVGILPNVQSLELELSSSACIRFGHWECSGITLPSHMLAHQGWMPLIKLLRRCHFLCSLTLHAAVACPIFDPRAAHVHNLQPLALLGVRPSQRVRAAAMCLWRSDGFGTEWNALLRQRLQLLRCGCMLGTVAARLSLFSERWDGSKFPVLILRHCFSMNGFNHLLRLLDAQDERRQ